MQATLVKGRACAKRGRNAFLDWLRHEKQLRVFHREFLEYRKHNTNTHFLLSEEDLYPCLNDRTEKTPVEPTYFYQDSWAFERIVQRKPAWHVDVGSRAVFVAFLSKVVPTTMVDIRPLSLDTESIQFVQGSILDLPFGSSSVESVSSLCVVEHIGLGRYGDPLDPYGSEKGMEELKRIVRPGGDLYLSVHLHDQNRVYFHAHRAFQEEYVLGLFEPFRIVDRRYICGRDFSHQRRPGFGTGCYHLRNPS